MNFIRELKSCHGPFKLLHKIPETGWLINNGNVFLTAPEAGKSRTKVPAWSHSGANPLPGSWQAPFRRVLL